MLQRGANGTTNVQARSRAAVAGEYAILLAILTLAVIAAMAGLTTAISGAIGRAAGLIN